MTAFGYNDANQETDLAYSSVMRSSVTGMGSVATAPLFVLSGTGATLGSGLNAGYYITRTINHTKLASEDRTDDLVFAVDATFAAMKSVSNGGHVHYATGADIHITDSTGTTEWTFYLEKYNPATGQVVLWIKPPSTTSSSADRTYLIAYGDSAISSTLGSSANTFPASIFDFAHGLGDNGAGGVVVTDRSANGLNATNHSSSVTLDTTSGLINGGGSFNRATPSYLTIPYNAALIPDFSTPKTVFVDFITPSSFPGAYMKFYIQQSSINYWFGFAISNANKLDGFGKFFGAFFDCIGTTTLATSTRYVGAYYCSNGTNGAKVYLNGAFEAQVNVAILGEETPDAIIGYDTFNATDGFTGQIGEIWQITGSRTAGFITAYSNALYDPSTFSTGTTETAV